MKDLDRVLNPNERFLEYRDYLIDLIASSYHKNFKDLIANRIKNTYYFFDSPPYVTSKALKRLNCNLNDLKTYAHIIYDYKIKDKEITEDINKYIGSYLKELLNISDELFYDNKNAILNLRHDAFSKEYNSFLTSDERLRSKVLKMQKDYLDSCEVIGLTPLTDEEKIEDYLDFLDRCERIYEQTIVRKTEYGKNLLNKLDENISSYHKLEIAKKALFFDEDDAARSMLFEIDKHNSIKILALPILKNIFYKSLDINLLHELAHVSEMGNKICSFVVDEKYRIFNEFRTQDKARYLLKKMRDDNVYIFDQDENIDIYKNQYDFFLPLLKSFIERHREMFDYSAINNRTSYIYKTLGRDNFDSYCTFLTDLYYNNFDIRSFDFDDSIILENNNLIDKMKTYTKKRGR